MFEHTLPATVMENNNTEDAPSKTQPLDMSQFDNIVVTKDSSTELIPTQLVESSADSTKTNKPALMMIRDLNAGKGMLDDDGKPIVGKVFSRVIQISGGESKPKQLKSHHHHHRGRSTSSCCRERQGPDKEKLSSTRPQSSNSQGGSNVSGSGSGCQCPTCNRQFSDEAVIDNNIVFCTGSSKDIM